MQMDGTRGAKANYKLHFYYYVVITRNLHLIYIVCYSFHFKSLVARKLEGEIPKRDSVREAEFGVSRKKSAKHVSHHSEIGENLTRSDLRLSSGRRCVVVYFQKLFDVLVEEVAHSITRKRK